MLFVRGDIENVLRSLGVAPEPLTTESTVPENETNEMSMMAAFESDIPEPEPEVDVDALFASASTSSKVHDLDAFWDDAVEKTGSIPINRDVITFEEARNLGLDPGNSQTIPLRQTGQLKKK
jgi:hypothetical protein